MGRTGQVDGKGGLHISMGGQYIRVGGTYYGGGEHADGVCGSMMEGPKTHWQCWSSLRAWA